jgi:fumarylacetoacetase
MEIALDETHDTAHRSWLESANRADTDFPLQNLPLGLFHRAPDARARLGVAIGDSILDLASCAEAGRLPTSLIEACRADRLNPLMALGEEARRGLRRAVFALLRHGATPVPDAWIVPQSDARMQVPAAIGDYTDFYASIHHATRVGALMRPDAPLLPNYKWVPIGYHGRASSIVASGTPIVRPHGQTAGDGGEAPSFAPSRRLDYEVEIGFFVGRGNALGRPVPIGEAEEALFGACLLNDWSARDVQKWEYQPLGPFLAKSFATTISPWIVTVDALAPFRGPLSPRASGDPQPLPYLRDARDESRGGFDIRVEAWLSTRPMRAADVPPLRVSAASFLDMYWSPAQLVAHHTSNGCNLQPGDLLASGTVSGPSEDSAGCLLERTAGGRPALAMPNGETRRFLEDGDAVELRAYCERPGFRRIGFGSCRGEVSG